jgi:tRNA(Ile)-lysidine synthase
VAGAARRLGEARALLAQVAEADLASIRQGRSLDLDGLQALDVPRRSNALRRWFESLGAGLAEDGLGELIRQLAVASPDSRIKLRCGPVDLWLWRGRLHAVDCVGLRACPPAMPWRGEPAVAWGNGTLYFDPAQGEGIAVGRSEGLELRSRGGGERIRLREGGPTRALRLLYQESAVPPWVRDFMPLVFKGGALVAVPGIGVAAGYAAAPGEPGRRLRWVG